VEKVLQKCYVFGYLEEKGLPVILLDKARRLLPFI
jgi:hypothetical protein